MTRIGQGLRTLRAEKGWSQEKLARETEMSKVTIWKTEHDRTNPDLRTLEALARAFNMDLWKFIQLCAREDLNPQPDG